MLVRTRPAAHTSCVTDGPADLTSQPSFGCIYVCVCVCVRMSASMCVSDRDSDEVPLLPAVSFTDTYSECLGGGRTLRLELAGRRPGGGARSRFMDVVKEDMELVGVRGEDAEDCRVRWRRMIGCDHP